MLNIQTERSGAGWCFDDLDSGGMNVQIEPKGNPLYTGSNDTYYNVDSAGTVHPPLPPQFWLCCDTYFMMSTQGMKYYRDRTPEGSQAA